MDYQLTFTLPGTLTPYDFVTLKDRLEREIQSYFDDKTIIVFLSEAEQKQKIEQNTDWSEEDEKFFKTALWHISYSVSNGKRTDEHCDTTDWLKGVKERLKFLKERIQPQPKQEWSEDDESNLDSAIYYIRREPYRECDVEPIVDWIRELKERIKEE